MSPPLLLKAPWEIRFPKGPQKIQGMRARANIPDASKEQDHRDTCGYSSFLFERIPCKQSIWRVASSNRFKATERPHLHTHFHMHTISSVLNTVERGD